MSQLTRYRGDSSALSIALTDPDTGGVFDPSGCVLLFTIKSDASAADAAALVQKISNVGGITVANPSVVSLVPADFASLSADIPYEFDIQAQNTTSGAVKTVARGTILFDQDVTKNLTITIDTIVINPSSPYLSAQEIEQNRQAAEAARDAAEEHKDDAEAARDRAREWSEKTDGPVDVDAGEYSAKHHALASGQSAGDANAAKQAAQSAAEQTALDVLQTAEDRVATGADRTAVADDKAAVQTLAEQVAADKQTVADDKATTEGYKTAAATSATAAAASAASVNAGELAARDAARAPRPGIISAGTSYVGTHGIVGPGTSSFTVGVRALLADLTPASTIYLVGNGGTSSVQSASSFRIGITAMAPAGRVAIGLRDDVAGGGTALYSSEVIPVADNSAFDLVLVFDRVANTIQPYCNGAPLGTPIDISAFAGKSFTSASALVWFGQNTNTVGTLFDGWIVAGALSASRIADIYKAGSIAPFCSYAPNTTTGRNVATIDGLSFFTWPDFERACPVNNPIAYDRSGNNQHAILGTSGLTAAVPLTWRNTAPANAIVSDGSTGSFVRATLNTQNPGTGDVTLVWEGLYPQDGSATTKVLAALTSSTSDVDQARALRLAYSTSGIFLTLYGATSDTRVLTSQALHNQLAALGARGISSALLVRRNSTGVRLFLGIGKDATRFGDVTHFFTESTTGTAPAWTDEIDGDYLVGYYRSTGSSTSAHTLYRLALANVGFTEAQLRTEYARDFTGLEWQWASQTPLYAANWSSGTDSWIVTNGTLTGNVDGVSDGVTSKDDCLRIVATNTASRRTSHPTGIINYGRYVRITGSVYLPSANTGATGVAINPTPNFGVDWFNGFGASGSLSNIKGTWTDFDTGWQRITSVGSTHLAFWLVDGVTTTGEVGDEMYLHNVRFYIGGWTTALRTDTAAGLTALNAAKSATNDSSDFLLSASGVTVQPDNRRQIIRPGTLTFTSPGTLNLQLFGASVVDTSKKWRIVSVSGTANGSANLSLGSASAGEQYVAAQAVTSGDFDIGTFANRRLSGANLWLKSDATVTITDLVVILEQVS